jgi:hypothetical protein
MKSGVTTLVEEKVSKGLFLSGSPGFFGNLQGSFHTFGMHEGSLTTARF